LPLRGFYLKNDPAREPIAVGWSIPGTICQRSREKPVATGKDFEVEQITEEHYRNSFSVSRLLINASILAILALLGSERPLSQSKNTSFPTPIAVAIAFFVMPSRNRMRSSCDIQRQSFFALRRACRVCATSTNAGWPSFWDGNRFGPCDKLA